MRRSEEPSHNHKPAVEVLWIGKVADVDSWVHAVLHRHIRLDFYPIDQGGLNNGHASHELIAGPLKPPCLISAHLRAYPITSPNSSEAILLALASMFNAVTSIGLIVLDKTSVPSRDRTVHSHAGAQVSQEIFGLINCAVLS